MHYALWIMHFPAPVAKLVDALDLGSNVSRCAGSSPVRRTKNPERCEHPSGFLFANYYITVSLFPLYTSR